MARGARRPSPPPGRRPSRPRSGARGVCGRRYGPPVRGAVHGSLVRVLWLSHFVPYPPSGGALQRSHNLLRQAARAHEVHLVALNQGALLGSPEAVAEAVRLLSDVCASVRVFPNAFDGSRVRWAWMAARGFWRSTPYDLNWLEQPALAAYLTRSEEHTSELQSHSDLVCRLLLEKKNKEID